MENYEEAKKLKSPAKNKAGRTLKITTKNLQDQEFPLELFLIRQKIKIRNTFAKNMSTDIKLSKA